MSRLNAPHGVYAVLGNHDYSDYWHWDSDNDKMADRAKLQEILHEMGWKLLNNSSTHLINRGDTIELIGVENWGEPPFTTYGDIYKAYPMFYNPDSVTNARFKILLSHNPEYWNRVLSHETDIDLTLSGHTHAMQMTVGKGKNRWSPAKYKYEQWGGMYGRENAKGDSVRLYVNIGSGEVGMPARFGATPEVTVFTLKSADKK